MTRLCRWLILLSVFCCWPLQASTLVFELTLEQHLFFPSRLEIPAGVKVKLIIHNKDPEPEEFDSFDLNREKVLFPGRRSVLFIGPLREGEYYYFGEYNPQIARGVIVATKQGSDARVD